MSGKKKQKNPLPFAAAERRLYQTLDGETKSLEEICRRTEMEAEEVAGVPTRLVQDGGRESHPKDTLRKYDNHKYVIGE